jgi:hypothetical protein
VGFDGHVLKPITREKLARLVRCGLAGRSAAGLGSA